QEEPRHHARPRHSRPRRRRLGRPPDPPARRARRAPGGPGRRPAGGAVKPAFYARTMLRESRGAFGRLAFFVACLAVGVAAVVAVAGLSASLDDGLRAEARQLLAADLRIEGSRPLPPGIDLAKVGLAGARRTDIVEMVTVVASQAGKSQLVELKVIDGDYPFYGKLVLAPARPLKDLLDPESAV